MPSYPDLVEAAEPMIIVERVEGDDMVIKGTCSRPMMVGVTSAMSELLTSPMLIGVLAGMIMPAIGSAREAAAHAALQAEAQRRGQAHMPGAMSRHDGMRELQKAVVMAHTWSTEHHGMLPRTKAEIETSHHLPPDSMAAMSYFPYPASLAQIKFPARYVLFSMESNDGEMLVAFADGHIESIPDHAQYSKLLAGTQDMIKTAGGHGHD